MTSAIKLSHDRYSTGLFRAAIRRLDGRQVIAIVSGVIEWRSPSDGSDVRVVDGPAARHKARYRQARSAVIAFYRLQAGCFTLPI